MRNTKDLRRQPPVGFRHVANGEAGKLQPRLRPAVRRRTRHSVADGIHEDDKIFPGIEYLVWPAVLEQFFRFAAQPRGPQNRIRPAGIQLPQRAVAEAEVMDYFPALELEIAQGRELLCAVGGGLRLTKSGNDEQPYSSNDFEEATPSMVHIGWCLTNSKSAHLFMLTKQAIRLNRKRSLFCH